MAGGGDGALRHGAGAGDRDPAHEPYPGVQRGGRRIYRDPARHADFAAAVLFLADAAQDHALSDVGHGGDPGGADHQRLGLHLRDHPRGHRRGGPGAVGGRAQSWPFRDEHDAEDHPAAGGEEHPACAVQRVHRRGEGHVAGFGVLYPGAHHILPHGAVHHLSVDTAAADRGSATSGCCAASAWT